MSGVKMDWDRVERDLFSQTQSLALGTASYPTADRFYALSVRPPPAPSSSSSSSSSNYSSSTSLASSPPEALLRELAELRNTVQQQARRMSVMERMLTTFGESLESVNTLQFGYSERIDTLEHEHRLAANTAAHAARERAELNIQCKTLTGRLQVLEESTRAKEDTYASKESFAQLLDTTVEQVRALSSITEGARIRSTQSITLTEALIQALYELNSGASGFRLDFLTSLSSGERQRDQIVRLLIDALQQAISVSVRNQFTPAIEVMSNLFRPQIEAIVASHASTEEDLRSSIKAVHSAMQTRVDRSAETASRLETSVHECEKATLEMASDLHKLKEIHAASVSSIQGVRETQAAQRMAINALTATQNNRQSFESIFSSSNDKIRSLAANCDALGEALHSLRLDHDSKVAELLRGLEKVKQLEMEQARKTERLEGQLKGDVGTVGLAQQNLQVRFDQLVKDVSARTTELDRSFTSVYKEVEDLKVGSRSRVAASSSSLTSEELQASVAALSQSLINLTMDTEELRSQQRQFQRSFDDDFGRLSERTGKSVEAVKEAMDALQQELLSVSDNVEGSGRMQDAKIAALKKEIVKLGSGSVGTASFGVVDTTPPARRASITSSSSAAASISPKSKTGGVFAEPTLASYQRGSTTTSASAAVKSKASSSLAGPPVSAARKTATPIISGSSSSSIYSNKSAVIKKATTAKAKTPTIKTTNTKVKVKGKDKDKESDSGSDLEASFLQESEEELEKLQHREQELDDDSFSASEEEKEAEDLGEDEDEEDEEEEDVIGREVLSPAQRDRQEKLQNLVELSSASPAAAAALPVLSGSLLSGRSGTAGIKGTTQGGSGGTTRTPLFESDLVLGPASASASAPAPASAAAETAAAARRTVEAAATLKKESVQCMHCLRRLPRPDIVQHVASCELRTEMCPNGCGANVRVLKMTSHIETCPKKK